MPGAADLANKISGRSEKTIDDTFHAVTIYTGEAGGSILEKRAGVKRFLLPVALAVLGLVAVVPLALLFSSGPPDNDSPEAGFARDMMVHHAQAVSMSEMVRDRTEDPAIRVLATDIVLSQQAEIGQMRGWLDAWSLPAASPEPPMAWMGHPTTGQMPGMATPEEMYRLSQAPPEEADEQFLRLMIVHHQAALPMADAVLERTDRPEVRRFAQKVLATQQAEIRGMQALLERKGLPPVEDAPSPATYDEHEHHGGS